MAPPGSLVSGWDVHHLPGKPPAGFEDFPEPSFVSSTSSSLRRNSLGTPSSPKLTGPPALGTVSQPHWTGSALGHHAGKHGDVDHHRRIQLAEHAETALNIGANALKQLLPGHGAHPAHTAGAHAAGAIPEGSVSAAQLQTGSFRDHQHYPVGSTGGRSLSDDGAHASEHHTTGLGWWSRLDSGRMNDAHIAEMEAEAVEEGPLSRRSRDYLHVPYVPSGSGGAVPLFRVMPVDTTGGGHATADNVDASHSHTGVQSDSHMQSAVGSAVGAAATPTELLQETHSGIGSGKDGAQAVVDAVGPSAAAPAHLMQTHAGLGSGKDGAQQVTDAAGALAAAPPELVQAHAGIGSGKDGAQQVAAVAEAQRVTLPSFTTAGPQAKAAVAKDVLLDLHEGIGSGKEGAAHVMEVVESEMGEK